MRLEDEISSSKFTSNYHKSIVDILYTYGWITNLLKKHIQLLSDYNDLLNAHSKLQEETRENFLIESMNDMKNQYNELKSNSILLSEHNEKIKQYESLLVNTVPEYRYERVSKYNEQLSTDLRNLNFKKIAVIEIVNQIQSSVKWDLDTETFPSLMIKLEYMTELILNILTQY